MTRIIYYISKTGENPVNLFLDSIEKRDKAKFFRIFQNIEEYGISTAIPHVKKITGFPLWEIRVLGQSNLRVLYAIVLSDSILVLHGFKKKKQKTPQTELETAINRLEKFKKDY